MSNPHNKPSPNQQPCPTCNGEGRYFAADTPGGEKYHHDCPDCNGSGKAKAKGVSELCTHGNYPLLCTQCKQTKPGVSEDSKPFTGVVTDSGGGMVQIMVDRDTESYPAKGESVRVTAALSPQTDTRPNSGTDANPEPKEPTKSQSFEDELHQILKEMSVETVRTWLDASRNQAATVRVWLKAEAAIKATVEKHYQIKEKANEQDNRHY